MSEPSPPSPEEARERVLSHLPTRPAASLPIAEAVGRGLAEDVHALRTLPPWDNSAMDGYALRAADSGPGARLKVVGVVAAGGKERPALGPGDCARIYTGAPLPPGADAVVMQEHVTVEGGQIALSGQVARGANVRSAGEDARKGELLLPRGTPIGLAEAALLWAQGFTEARVPRPPTVAIFSTGDELCAIGEAEGDRIVDSNSPSLALAVVRAGGVPTVLPLVRDSLEETVQRLEEAGRFDVVITSAGASVGDRDFVIPALRQLGVSLQVKKVRIKPGKPFAFGTRGQTLFFSLPGNPTSSMVTFELFVRPALRRLCGIADVAPPRVCGRLSAPLKKSVGLTHYVRARAAFRDGALWAEPLASQTSGALRSAASATHLIELEEAASSAEAGQPVTLLPVSWAA